MKEGGLQRLFALLAWGKDLFMADIGE